MSSWNGLVVYLFSHSPCPLHFRPQSWKRFNNLEGFFFFFAFYPQWWENKQLLFRQTHKHSTHTPSASITRLKIIYLNMSVMSRWAESSFWSFWMFWAEIEGKNKSRFVVTVQFWIMILFGSATEPLQLHTHTLHHTLQTKKSSRFLLWNSFFLLRWTAPEFDWQSKVSDCSGGRGLLLLDRSALRWDQQVRRLPSFSAIISTF